MEDRRAHDRIDTIELQLDIICQSLQRNTELTQSTATSTAELVSILRDAKGFRSVLLFFAPIVAAVIATFQWIRGH
jgi:hypothetical protein